MELTAIGRCIASVTAWALRSLTGALGTAVCTRTELSETTRSLTSDSSDT